MTERDMTLGTDWNGQNIAGWFWSEKYDGCRAYWDGRRLWTRGGNVIAAPDWFTAGLPAGVPLDCEVYFGPGRFEDARLAVQAGRWGRDARLVVFDAPMAPGDWSARMEAASGLPLPPHVTLASRGVLPSRGSASRALAICAEVKAAGGEGLVLRRPGVPYEQGRTGNTLKVKSEFIG